MLEQKNVTKSNSCNLNRMVMILMVEYIYEYKKKVSQKLPNNRSNQEPREAQQPKKTSNQSPYKSINQLPIQFSQINSQQPADKIPYLKKIQTISPSPERNSLSFIQREESDLIKVYKQQLQKQEQEVFAKLNDIQNEMNLMMNDKQKSVSNYAQIRTQIRQMINQKNQEFQEPSNEDIWKYKQQSQPILQPNYQGQQRVQSQANKTLQGESKFIPCEAPQMDLVKSPEIQQNLQVEEQQKLLNTEQIDQQKPQEQKVIETQQNNTLKKEELVDIQNNISQNNSNVSVHPVNFSNIIQENNDQSKQQETVQLSQQQQQPQIKEQEKKVEVKKEVIKKELQFKQPKEAIKYRTSMLMSSSKPQNKQFHLKKKLYIFSGGNLKNLLNTIEEKVKNQSKK